MEGLLLSVKHFPAALSAQAIETLLKHVGATQIRVLTNRTQKSKSALASFPDETTRMSALGRLNKMRLSDHDICASLHSNTASTPSEHDETTPTAPTMRSQPVPSAPPTTAPEAAAGSAIFPPLPREDPPTYAWGHPASLAPHLGLHFPPSPLLEYKYPKASPDVVLNIANALIALPKFYTQVLHLMNKMNLPPPFEPNSIPGPFLSFVVNDGKKKRKPDATFVQEHDDDDMPVGSMSAKQRRVLDSGPRSVAAINLPPPLPPTTAASPSVHHHTSAQVAASTELPSLPTPPVVVAAPLKILPQKPRKPDSALATIFEADTTSTATKLVPRPGVISDAELTRTRLSSEELSQHKHMQTYQRNEPSNVLYVKNIAASVDISDLTYVFGSVFDSDDAMSYVLGLRG
ncbi:hypothetical protein, variant 1 [Aphanomyces astaci]|uniref:RRM domain-containing protein n=1 Tax=Aphanomyces astaci TaxID=112090 RepID=W4H2P6_APHAT|nr:hypothetical protein, variant 1 [Aphanomyces astaci]ETV85876.1 hypothetical protein, variant 1 [Aphanomyces astaci]|eukprot:XP_009824350.1 hypothetical protein, variant 1 [Aphanomyces astaci]